MKEVIKRFVVCDYCGLELQDDNEMKIHEEVCPHNPKNQPCCNCSNQIIGIGCSKGCDMEAIGGNVLCFCYKEGKPMTTMEALLGGLLKS